MRAERKKSGAMLLWQRSQLLNTVWINLVRKTVRTRKLINKLSVPHVGLNCFAG